MTVALVGTLVWALSVAAGARQTDSDADLDALSAATVMPETIYYPEAGEGRQEKDAPLVTIGLPDTADVALERPVLLSTIEKFGRAMPGTRFRIRTILLADGPAQLNLTKPDFVFAPTGADALWRREGIESYRIATRKNERAREAAKSTGSVIVTLKSREDLQDLDGLRGKNVVAGLPDSVPGWLAVLGEVEKAGFDSEDFFGSVEFLSEYYPEIIAALWGGWADAAVLPACYLEALSKQGLAATDELKVLNEQTDEALACRRSTALYPDISLVGFSWTPERLVRDVTVALMSEQDGSNYEWLSYVSHAGVDELFKTLKAGPYDYLRDYSLQALYARHALLFHTAGIVLFLLVLHGILLQLMVRRRTRELSETLAEQKRMEQQAREHRRRLGWLERRNIVNQMSGMIAHEINSPVGAICNFKAILDMLLADRTQTDPNVAVALEGIEREAQRIAGIVGRVRSYAKQQKHAHKPCDLVDVSRRAVRALRLSSTVKADVREHYAVDKAVVLGDSLELELLVLNLLRNASEVQPNSGDRVRVRLAVAALSDGRLCVEVSDNGREIADQELARLSTLMRSLKPEGLGMGLSIVRGIADSHGAELVFEKAQTGGVRVIFTIDALRDAPQTENQEHQQSSLEKARESE